jgi:hypothetical protein
LSKVTNREIALYAEREQIELENALKHIASEWGITELQVSDEMLAAAKASMSPGLVRNWKELPSEYIGGGPDSLGMILVRRKRQLAYSFKLSNFFRDPIVSMSAASTSVFAATYIPSVLAAPTIPPTFPGFLIGLCFSVLRAIGHPVGYGEASLLHRMNEIAEAQREVNELAGAGRFVAASEVAKLGAELVERYGYQKGNNSNEISSLLKSLIGWGAIKEVKGGYEVIETVPYGLGRVEYY